jgi:hypothetical protein
LSSGFQRRTGYITPEYFKEKPGISPPDISKETTLKKQLTGDNPVQNRQTRRQPWKKQLTGDNPVKKQTDKEKTLGKNKKSPQYERGTNVSMLKGKPGQGDNLGQKQEITPRRTGNRG